MSTEIPPRTIAEAIPYFEAEIARIRSEWPEFTVGEPSVEGEETLLDELVVFMTDYPAAEAEKKTTWLFSASGGSVLGVWINVKQGLAVAAAALAAFCRLRKCSISIKMKNHTIKAEAPNILGNPVKRSTQGNAKEEPI